MKWGLRNQFLYIRTFHRFCYWVWRGRVSEIWFEIYMIWMIWIACRSVQKDFKLPQLPPRWHHHLPSAGEFCAAANGWQLWSTEQANAWCKLCMQCMMHVIGNQVGRFWYPFCPSLRIGFRVFRWFSAFLLRSFLVSRFGLSVCVNVVVELFVHARWCFLASVCFEQCNLSLEYPKNQHVQIWKVEEMAMGFWEIERWKSCIY